MKNPGEPFNLKDRVALITGGSSGIGRSTAFALARAGAQVIIVADKNRDGLEESVSLARSENLSMLSLQLDVSQSNQVEDMMAFVKKELGRLDYAVNSAGIEGDIGPTHECSEENWDRVLTVNLKGVWLCLKEQIKMMLPQGTGSIVNVSSAAGDAGFPYWPAYAASKHGIIGLTKTAALEYAKQGLRINAVAPGAIKTPMLNRIFDIEPSMEEKYLELEPVGRIGSADEAAQAIVWLLSDAASFVTGHTLAVDGGFLAT